MPEKETLIYLSLGSNLGDRFRNLKSAGELIGKNIGRTVDSSHIYESAAWGYSSDRLFFNCCLSVYTELDPFRVLESILSIESSMGRVRTSDGYADRSIDMDLLFFGNTVLDHPRLTIPHPEVEKRRFVLLPLSEIAPGLVHPVNGMSVVQMLGSCPDQGEVRPVR